MINLSVFKRKICSYLFNNLNFSSINDIKNYKIFLGLHHQPTPPPRLHNCIWNKQHLFAYKLLCSDSSLYAVILLSIIDQCRLFYLWDRRWISDVLEGCIILLIWAAWVLFNFYLKQKKKVFSWSLTENASFIYF